MFVGLSCGCKRIVNRRLSCFYPKIHQNRIHHEYSPGLNWPKRQIRFYVNTENRGVVITEAGSHLRPIDSCITHLKAQGPSRTYNESEEEGLNFIRKAFQFKKLLAIKFTTQHHLY